MSGPPKVFISYSRDTDEHAERVLTLADQLRADGIDAIIDRYQPHPEEGWPLWMDQNIQNADFILIICTETYYRRVMGEERPGTGLGVRWEGNIIYNHIYNNNPSGSRFVPILLDGAKVTDIPTPLRGHSQYHIRQFDLSDEGYEGLYRHLTNQPFTLRPELGKLQKLPPRSKSPSSSEPSRLFVPEPPKIPAPLQERYELIESLNGLPEEQLGTLIFMVKPPDAVMPSSLANKGQKVLSFLNWADGSTGCGLQQVRLALKMILGPA